MIPNREVAYRLLTEAEKLNPGLWVAHSKAVAFCAEKIAINCVGLDVEKAYVLGLLHDIGRKVYEIFCEKALLCEEGGCA